MAIAARATQSAVVVLAKSGQNRSRVTQSAVIALTWPACPSRATQSAVVILADNGPTTSAVTQSLVVILCNQQEIEGLRTARVTQSAVVVLVDTSCVDLLGTWYLSWRDLRRRTLVLLGEDPSSPVYWTIAEIGRYVNDAYLAICRDTKVLEFIESTATIAGTAEYMLTNYVLQIKRIFLDDWTLPNVTAWERDREFGNWQGQSNKIRGYITSQQNNRRVLLDQTPTAVEDMDVWAVMLPDTLEDRCDAPEIPQWTHPAIAFKAASRALRKYGEPRNVALADAYDAMADDYLSQLVKLIGNRIGERTWH